MKKLGRPKIAAADRRETIIRLRLTEAEYSRLRSAAKKAGQNVSEYARKLLVR
jgi:uncharacterized protein (DUF1778 family)